MFQSSVAITVSREAADQIRVNGVLNNCCIFIALSSHSVAIEVKT